jgi:FKBP-type peptidyl-prolyl cis-trans isomerase
MSDAAAQVRPADSIAGSLKKAQQDYLESLDKARSALLDEFDKQIKKLETDAKLEAKRRSELIDVLKEERKAFESTKAILPQSQKMRLAASDYRKAVNAAKAKCARAFDKAADSYRRKRDFASADATFEEKQVFLDQDEKRFAKARMPDLADGGWRRQASGLHVWDVKEGKGEAVKPGEIVVVHYTGWLEDGTVFDSSSWAGSPLELPLTNAIDGWKKGLPGMRPGAVRRLIVPPEMGYATKGVEGRIPPDATLIFEVQLLKARNP